MLFDKWRVSSTQNVEEMVEGIRTRSPQFLRIAAKHAPGWHYTFNRMSIGTVRIGISKASHVEYRSSETKDVVLTGCFSGTERMTCGGDTRSLSEIPSFSPIRPASGEIRDSSFYTVRLDPERLLSFLAELEGSIELTAFLEANWLTPLPGGVSFGRFLHYVFHQIEEYGLPTPTEQRALEELIYANAARILIIEQRRPSLSGNAKIFARCASYIEENLESDLSIMDVVRVSGLSLRSVQLMFRQLANKSITGFILERRLLRAQKILSEADDVDSVQAACFASGFRHLSYFSRAYRDRFGELPSSTLRRRA
jgi:AraC-like DNA-binding protein